MTTEPPFHHAQIVRSLPTWCKALPAQRVPDLRVALTDEMVPLLWRVQHRRHTIPFSLPDMRREKGESRSDTVLERGVALMV